MTSQTNHKVPLSPGGARRRARKVAESALFQISPLFSDQDFGQIIQANEPDCSLIGWLTSGINEINTRLNQQGALLFRGFDANAEQDLGEVSKVLGNPLSYTYRSTPRTEVKKQVYTSTEYPAEQIIPLHNENAYSLAWPKKLLFHCAMPATIKGGNTPLADSGQIYQNINPDIRDKFERLGVTYVRNYGEYLDLSWQIVFQTQDKQQVEDYCRRAKIDFTWKTNGQLQTRQRCPAVQKHPITGNKVWFNQAHLFHVSALPQELLKSLEQQPDSLPRHALYGDGSEIEAEVLQHIRAVYDSWQREFEWQKGDTLLMDNLLVAHGRTPYEGQRKILVAMLDDYLVGDRCNNNETNNNERRSAS